MTIPTLRQVIDVCEELWPAHYAQAWDSVGLAVGDPNTQISHILCALDPVDAVIDEAVTTQADLLFTHHPLMLKPVNSVAAHTLKGGAVHTLIRNGVAQFNAHTNADAQIGGVSDVLADIIGLRDRTVLVPQDNAPPGVGIGRVGTLPRPVSLRELSTQLAKHLPATPTGIRYAGDPDALITTVAILAGAGDSAFADVRATAAEVYITSDLRHHPATEALDTSQRSSGTPYLIDVVHFAAESPWISVAARQLRSALTERGFVVTVDVSTVNSDPWTGRIEQE